MPPNGEFEVVIPTRDRPDRLARCLESVARARGELDLPVLIADSSEDAAHAEVLELASRYPFARVARHDGRNIPEARNFCVRAARRQVLISVDDDTQVEPNAFAALIDRYWASPKPCVVAGSTAWNGEFSQPIVTRYTGYGRPVRDGEQPAWLVTALIAFPRDLALALPWNERLDSADDIFVGYLWRSHGVNLCFEPAARSIHDPIHSTYGVDSQYDLVYANLFDALFANPSWRRTLAYEFLGFAAGAKTYFRSLSSAKRFVLAWARGNFNLFRDRRQLRQLLARELPESLNPDA